MKVAELDPERLQKRATRRATEYWSCRMEEELSRAMTVSRDGDLYVEDLEEFGDRLRYVMREALSWMEENDG